MTTNFINRLWKFKYFCMMRCDIFPFVSSSNSFILLDGKGWVLRELHKESIVSRLNWSNRTNQINSLASLYSNCFAVVEVMASRLRSETSKCLCILFLNQALWNLNIYKWNVISYFWIRDKNNLGVFIWECLEFQNGDRIIEEGKSNKMYILIKIESK